MNGAGGARRRSLEGSSGFTHSRSVKRHGQLLALTSELSFEFSGIPTSPLEEAPNSRCSDGAEARLILEMFEGRVSAAPPTSSR